ncbi:nucleolar protein 14 homolog isoform X2 [Harmonia axyridis]|uniref:nucleolar protein 14 homolog isoform X2 n=1 Tax=Harmonia axyridis TaxID=115357 RepID=UPI001E275967|nr:nucleolar protein 14 homolog isoform X2 [Harmonia axyridis]
MAKTKSKKKVLSEKVQNKKNSAKTNRSPFEVHINKERLKVLGRKSKNNIGFPGLSRAKAIDKRKKTLLEEFKNRDKSHVFKDRRIGENDPSLGEEEKHVARFAAIRQNAYKKKSIFNLNDDVDEYACQEEILTHKGKTISEIEQFEDCRSDDEMDDEDNGKLSKDFVGQLHFGGGFLTKKDQDGTKSHKDFLEEIIAESKKRKAEKKQTKEELNDLTEKLDAEWKDLIPLRSNKIMKRAPKEADEFDKIMNTLRFEARGNPSDPLKSEEETAKQEKEKLERLETERLERMKAVDDDDPSKYRSADDLEDNLVYESLSEEENNEESEERQVENEEEGEDDEESGAETDSEDDLSDLKAETSESEDEHVIKKKKVLVNGKKSKELPSDENKEERGKDLPFTFSFPEDDEKLQSLLSEHSAVNQGIIVERIIKCYHISLLEANRVKLGILFKYILQYINDIASEATEEESIRKAFSIFNELAPHLFDLAQMNQKICHDSVQEVIREKFEEYVKKPKVYPDLEVLFFLKLVGLLFPTSDFKHRVVTPCFVFMEKMFMNCRVHTRRDVAFGLFLSTLVLEYTSLSKRYMPGCLTFLGGILHMAVPKTTVRIIKVSPPFKSLSADLVLLENSCSLHLPPKMEVDDLVEEEITESFKVRAVYTTLKIAMEFFENFKEYPSNLEIFEPIYSYCKLIKSEMYPEEVRNEIKSVIDLIENSKSQRILKYLQMEAAKPKILRLYEPNIMDVYDRKSHRNQSKEKAEYNKLLHKIKREKKGALREIRRDNAFLGRVQISQQIGMDKERKELVKRIFADANIQQCELNEMDRKRKKK